MKATAALPATRVAEPAPGPALPVQPTGAAARLGWALALSVPIAAGLLSLWLGQDATWDLRNYHLYVAWAYLGERLSLDMAPGQMQSYLNPWIDLPYYWMATNWPARWTGFAFGAAHGLVIIPLYAISCRLLPYRAAAACAVAGCLGPVFLYQLGSTMGDNTAALLVLPAVAVMLRALSQLPADTRTAARGMAMAGLLAGAAAGLKLTNAPAALALCAMPLAAGCAWGLRMRRVAWVGVATAIGVLATGGHWFWTMYQQFGNPLFPQFNGLFRSEMAAGVMVLDDRWGPRGAVQTMLWPVISVVQPWKFGERWMMTLTLAASYLALLSWGLVAAHRAWRGQLRAPAPLQGRDSALAALVWFVVVTYLAWLEVFAIGRYIVTLDLLAPALLATLCWRLWGARAVPRSVWVVLAFFSVLSLLNLKTWGKVDWGDAAYAVELPPIASPEKTAVLMVGDEAQSWKALHFPPGTVFAGIGGNFPASAAWNVELRRWLDRREHLVAVIQMPEAVSTRQVSGPFLFNAAARAIAATPILATEGRCGVARALVARVFFKSGLQAQAERDGDVVRCRLSLPAQPTLSDQALADARLSAMADASALLEAQGLRLDRPSCAVRAAFIGSISYPYVACAVERPGFALK
jgi:hypothetical protein